VRWESLIPRVTLCEPVRKVGEQVVEGVQRVECKGVDIVRPA